QAFKEICGNGKELLLPEPRLRDTLSEDDAALNLLNKKIDSVLPEDLNETDKQKCTEVLWSVLEDAEALERAAQQIETLREEVWQPFAQRALVLAEFEYLDFAAERVTERGRWLADLHIDRPLLVGEALEHGLFAGLDVVTVSAVMAALSADED